MLNFHVLEFLRARGDGRHDFDRDGGDGCRGRSEFENNGERMVRQGGRLWIGGSGAIRNSCR